MRYAFFIIAAVCIDAFQALLALVLAGIFAFPGTIGGSAAGCAAGAYVAGKVGCAVGGAIAGVAGSFFNAPLAAAGEPIGLILGDVMDFVISASFGAGFVICLCLFGLLPWREFFTFRRLPLVVAKFVPFIEFLPTYTALTVLCVLRNAREERERAARALSTAVAGAAPINAAAQAANRLSPAVARGSRQLELSAYESQNQEEEVQGRAAAERIRPQLEDIRVRATATPQQKRSDNASLNSYGLPA